MELRLCFVLDFWWGRLVGNQVTSGGPHGAAQATASFKDGLPAGDLAGKWKVTLYDDTECSKRFQIDGKDYEPEIVECKVNGSVVSMQAIATDGQMAYLWAEGRLSLENKLTLIVWPDKDARFNTRRIVSVNLLRLKSSDGTLVLRGMRMGVDIDADGGIPSAANEVDWVSIGGIVYEKAPHIAAAK